jgi:hypothetical protein
MIKRRTTIIKLDDNRIADAVDELRDALAEAPIYIDRNKLCWRFPADGAVLPLTSQRLRFEMEMYVRFTKDNKPAPPPKELLSMFLDVAAIYRWFPDLPEEE